MFVHYLVEFYYGFETVKPYVVIIIILLVSNSLSPVKNKRDLMMARPTETEKE
jgi:hypothetical protein